MKNKKEKIVLGMSGGVDSSVAAFLLKKQGYKVVGVFMQNWDSILNFDIKGGIDEKNRKCFAQKDFDDAKKVADFLGIEIHRIEFIKEYWDNVFLYLINEYKSGRTPNPDVLCNKYIKFDSFIKYAQKQFNCDQIAMGHYANVEKVGATYNLIKSKTDDKDQTYFLCWLNQNQLSKSLFPIGNLTKSEVRDIAKKEKIPTWAKKDSTGICFIGERKFKDFLNNYIPIEKGDVLDIETKKKIGFHDGVFFYTNGQNKGLGLGGSFEKYFVCGKDMKNNILFVCPESKKEKYLLSNNAIVADFNWINGVPSEKKCEVRFRHRQKLINCEFKIENDRVILNYEKSLSVSPGQFAVLYQNKICLGGGVVEEASMGNTNIL